MTQAAALRYVFQLNMHCLERCFIKIVSGTVHFDASLRPLILRPVLCTFKITNALKTPCNEFINNSTAERLKKFGSLANYLLVFLMKLLPIPSSRF